MPLAGFEPTIPVFKRAKTFYALGRAATVTGTIKRLVGVKFSFVIIFINIIIIIAIATRRPRLHSHQSDAPQYIKTLDRTGLNGVERRKISARAENRTPSTRTSDP
jgi:hypothetical protein